MLKPRRRCAASTEPGTVIPTITGRAYITGEATLILEDDDPFREGIGS
ncbi:MAG: proline racemase family protein [Phycisphaeraceae bacterium]|nr:proline racemase family protein [Phycisphaeraceae bacterium]